MAKKPTLTLEPNYRSPLEVKIAKQLKDAGIEAGYETRHLECVVPARTAKYIADWDCGYDIIIEGKGNFGYVWYKGGPKIDKRKNVEARRKLLLIKQQNPGVDIRIVFERAHAKLYTGCKMTNAEWAEEHGFKWADKGTVPEEWIKEIKEKQRDGDGTAKQEDRGRTQAKPAGKKRAVSPRKRAADA